MTCLMANILNEISANVLGILRASRVIMIMVLSYVYLFASIALVYFMPSHVPLLVELTALQIPLCIASMKPDIKPSFVSIHSYT